MATKTTTGTVLGFLLAVSLIALILSIVPKSAFMVGGTLGGPISIQAGPQYWERSCFGVVRSVAIPDAAYDYCIGIPHGKRRCYGYPPLPGPGFRADVKLPLGPLHEMSCPAGLRNM